MSVTPAFGCEEEWSAAYAAAHDVLDLAVARGDLLLPTNTPWTSSLRQIAVQVATAVIHSSDREYSDDIMSVPEVSVEKVSPVGAIYGGGCI
jgi:hypothetical protein